MDSASITTEDRGGVAVLVLSGELDLAVADDLRIALRELPDSNSHPPTVDLSAVSFLDSSCLGALLEFQLLQPTGIRMVLVAPSAPCRRLFEITRVDELFEFRD